MPSWELMRLTGEDFGGAEGTPKPSRGITAILAEQAVGKLSQHSGGCEKLPLLQEKQMQDLYIFFFFFLLKDRSESAGVLACSAK